MRNVEDPEASRAGESPNEARVSSSKTGPGTETSTREEVSASSAFIVAARQYRRRETGEGVPG